MAKIDLTVHPERQKNATSPRVRDSLGELDRRIVFATQAGTPIVPIAATTHKIGPFP